MLSVCGINTLHHVSETILTLSRTHARTHARCAVRLAKRMRYATMLCTFRWTYILYRYIFRGRAIVILCHAMPPRSRIVENATSDDPWHCINFFFLLHFNISTTIGLHTCVHWMTVVKSPGLVHKQRHSEQIAGRASTLAAQQSRPLQRSVYRSLACILYRDLDGYGLVACTAQPAAVLRLS